MRKNILVLNAFDQRYTANCQNPDSDVPILIEEAARTKNPGNEGPKPEEFSAP